MLRRRRSTVTLIAVLACALLALALPALASARNFIVNDPGDTGTQAACETNPPVGACTLRGAIDAANVDSTPDIITFDISVFEGEVGTDEIELEAALPKIEKPVSIGGSSCFLPSYDAPCVGVEAQPGGSAFLVESPEVQISGLSITGEEAGIEVDGASTGFVAKGDWLGLRLDGFSAGTTLTQGIVLGPEADGARIGGVIGETLGSTEDRNVIDESEIGILVEGASQTEILGNYIGVDPEGSATGVVETGVRIVDAGAAKAEGNEVGGVLSPQQAATTACDGPCNVIAAAGGGTGIDLAGAMQTAASGPTTVRGNYLNLAASGTAPVTRPFFGGEPEYGILAASLVGSCEPGPGDVSIGGTSPTETNFIEGGSFGVFAEAAENFSVAGNKFGIAANGADSTSPIDAAIHVCSEGVTEPAHVSENEIRLEPDPIGIASSWGRAQIVGNSIEGGLHGIQTSEASEGAGDLIQGNLVEGADRQGILIENDSNVLVGNTISGAGWAGITIEQPAEHNRVGGDLADERNLLLGNGFGNSSGAIQINGEESSRNEVAANTGIDNEGAFIELGGPELPNELEPPVVTAALQSSATGTAAPGTKVRVFTKTLAEEGELGRYLGAAVTDSAGVWKATFAQVPTGTLIAATQTSAAGTPAAGTSEVSASVAALVDPTPPPNTETGGGDKGTTGGGDNTKPISTPAPTKPKVKITVGPKKSSSATTAKFKFKAEPAAGAKFECKLDNDKWAKCRSPRTYRKLAVGKHTFRVRATAAGLTSSAAKYQFAIKR